MNTEPHRFRAADLVGGHIALDLANTVTARDSVARDWLADTAAALDWAAHTGQFTARETAALEQRARAAPRKAAAALARLKQLREALCTACAALALGRTPDAAALQVLDKAAASAAQAARLQLRDGVLARRWRVEDSGLDLPAHRIAAQAVELLEQLAVERLRICAGQDCGWLFLDTSKSGRRRWCDMATCGNSAKAARFATRQRAPQRRGRRA
jgi:predicted RNA-binding Zn ribbon-like protein